jgi:4,5:9,10-diseco-3-hydroxy-5,9,17-trioxoandrosta-1(10),2-diene-4-oate hydrolase
MSVVSQARWSGVRGSRTIATVGRALVAAIFIFAGVSKIVGPQPYLDHMQAFGVPAILLPAVIALEIGAGVTLLVGWRQRAAAGALGIFCLLTAVIFHHELGIKAERTHFFKDLAIAGGLLMTAANAEAVRRARASTGASGLTSREWRAATLGMTASTAIPRSTTRIMADGVSLAVHRTGRGEPVVCLSAIGHDCRDFDALVGRLADRFEFVCIEWPGHGESGADTHPVSAARYADLLVAALDRLQLEAPILLGNSIGATASILCASRRPVRAVVLCDSGGLVEVTPLVARLCRVYERFFAAGERGARWFGPAFRAYYRMVLTEPAAAAQRRRIAAAAPMRARLFREAWASFGAASADIRNVAAALVVPIWVAWADHDRTVPLSYCVPALCRLKNATLSTFNAGHAPFLEQPDAFADGFLRFVTGLPTPLAEGARACQSI